MVVLGVVVLLLVEGYMHMLRPGISEHFGQQISQGLGLLGPSTDPALQGMVDQQLEQAQQTLPTALAALPPGEVVLTEQQANSYLAANREALQPVESLQVRFVPGEVQADLRIYGLQASVRANLLVQDGQVYLVNTQVDGLLGSLISLEELIDPVQRSLNDLLRQQNQAIVDGRIEQGQLVVALQQM